MAELGLEKRQIGQPNAPDLTALVNQPTMLSQMFAQGIQSGVDVYKASMELEMTNRVGVARNVLKNIYNEYSAKPRPTAKDYEDMNAAFSGVKTKSVLEAPKYMKRKMEQAITLDEADYQTKFGKLVTKATHESNRDIAALNAYEISNMAGQAAFEGKAEQVSSYAKELAQLSVNYYALGGSEKSVRAMQKSFESSVTYNLGMRFVQQGATQEQREKRFREFVGSRSLIEDSKYSQEGVEAGFSKLSTYMKRMREKASNSTDVSMIMSYASNNKALTNLATSKQANLFVDLKAKHIAVENQIKQAREQGQGGDLLTYGDIVANLATEHKDWSEVQIRTEAQIRFDEMYPNVSASIEDMTLAQSQILKPSQTFMRTIEGFLIGGDPEQFIAGVNAVKKLQDLESGALTADGGLSDDLISLAIQGKNVLSQSGVNKEDLGKQIKQLQDTAKAPKSAEAKLKIAAFSAKNNIATEAGKTNALKMFKKYVGASPSLVNQAKDLQEFMQIATAMMNTNGVLTENEAFQEAGNRIKMRYGSDIMSVIGEYQFFRTGFSEGSGYKYPLTRYNADGHEKMAINNAAEQLAKLGIQSNDYLMANPNSMTVKSIELLGNAADVLNATDADLANKRYYSTGSSMAMPDGNGVLFKYGGREGRLALSESEVKVPMYDQEGNLIGHRLTWKAWHQRNDRSLVEVIDPTTGEQALIVQHFMDEIAPKQAKAIKKARLQSETFAANASDLYQDIATAGYGADESLSMGIEENEVSDIKDGTFADKTDLTAKSKLIQDSVDFEQQQNSVQKYLSDFKLTSFDEVRQVGVQEMRRISKEAVASAKEVITRYAKQYGVPVEAAIKIAEKESRFDHMAKAATSSAKGLFQFINQTWESMVNRYGRQLNVEMGDVFDVAGNTKMGVMLIKENMNIFQRQFGREPNAKEIYAMHFAGPTVGLQFIKAAIENPQTPVENIFPPRWILANKSILKGTVKEAFERLTKDL